MITSLSNPKIKRLVSLRDKAKFRYEEKAFIVEGYRIFLEIPEELIEEVYVTESFVEGYFDDEKLRLFLEDETRYEVVSAEVFAKASATKTPQGILAVVRVREWTLNEVLGGFGKAAGKEGDKAADGSNGANSQSDKNSINCPNPCIMILDGIQDPGNLGTIFRTAEGAGATGVVLLPGCTDPYSPKAVRSTMGSLFRLPFIIVDEKDREKVLEELKVKGVKLYAACLDGDSQKYSDIECNKAIGFVIGNEGNGISAEVLESCTEKVYIPMAGKLESLNAAVSASVLLYEAFRQRGFEKN